MVVTPVLVLTMNVEPRMAKRSKTANGTLRESLSLKTDCLTLGRIIYSLGSPAVSERASFSDDFETT